MTLSGATGGGCRYPGYCPAELAHVDPLGTASVADDESILRATYENHWRRKGKPTTKVQPDFINNRELRDREGLSVWRREKLPDPSKVAVEKHLAALNDEEPFRVAFQLSAGQIRSIADQAVGRALSVLNHTATGPDRDPHPAHAALFVCASTAAFDAAYAYAKRSLIKEFSDSPMPA